MLEHLVATFLGTLALGLATWHIVRVISEGYLFEPFRKWLRNKAHKNFFLHSWWRAWDCRLCFDTEVAIALTWGALVVGLVVEPGLLPAAEWAYAFAVGPFLTAAWAEVVRRIECLEAPE